jgi:hypothetical protein
MTPAIIPAANKRQGQQNSTTSTGGGGGAFTGIVRSAADTGAVTLEKLNKHANPIAKMLRRIVNPLFLQLQPTRPQERNASRCKQIFRVKI